jgi:multidrug efflux system outer membrane protein
MTRRAALLAPAVLVAACSTAPSLPLYQPPLAPQFANADTSAATGAHEPVAQFWRGFHDPDLDLLVTAALAANADLRLAAANLAEARALARAADAEAAPEIGVSATAGRARLRDTTTGQPFTANAFGAGLDMRWEADLFGAIRGERRAAAAEALASAAQLRAVQVSVAAEVARNYFQLRGLQEQLRVAVAALDSQRETASLVNARLSAGRSNAFDADRADALVQSTAATVPDLDSALVRTRYRLAVLSGQTPTALDARLAAPRPLPGIAPTALGQLGSPQSLLRRRPDVAVAEQQVAAAAARIGVARSQLFPQLTLAGNLGLNAGRVGALDQRDALAFNLGATLVWSLVDFGRRRALVAAASARGAAAMAAYEKTVLGALEETEGALAAYTRAQRRAENLHAAALSAGSAAELARIRFNAGSSDLLAVLDAERESLAARDRLAQASTASATSLVAVYKALAGGW